MCFQVKVVKHSIYTRYMTIRRMLISYVKLDRTLYSTVLLLIYHAEFLEEICMGILKLGVMQSKVDVGSSTAEFGIFIYPHEKFRPTIHVKFPANCNQGVQAIHRGVQN